MEIYHSSSIDGLSENFLTTLTRRDIDTLTDQVSHRVAAIVTENLAKQFVEKYGATILNLVSDVDLTPLVVESIVKKLVETWKKS